MTAVITVSLPNTDLLDQIDKTAKLQGKSRSEFICDVLKKAMLDVYNLPEEQIVQQLKDYDSEMIVLRNALQNRREANKEADDAIQKEKKAEEQAKIDNDDTQKTGKWFNEQLTELEREELKKKYKDIPVGEKPVSEWNWRREYWRSNVKGKE